MNAQIIERDPADLSIHPLLRNLPEWANDDPRFLALVDDIKQNGIHDPLQVAGNQIADGRHRWRAAKRLQLNAIPTIPIDETQVPLVAAATILHRRHYSPGQRAYVLVPIIDDVFDAARQRQLAALKRGSAPGASPVRNCVPSGDYQGLTQKTVEDWAKEIGVSTRYLREAKKIWDLFGKYKDRKWSWTDKHALALLGLEPDAKLTFKEYYEPLILSEEKPIGLGAAIAGMGQKIEQAKRGSHEGGIPTEVEKQQRLFEKAFLDLSKRFDYWTGFPEKIKTKALEPFKGSLEQMPEDLLMNLFKATRTEIARRKKDRKNKTEQALEHAAKHRAIAKP